MLLAWHITLPIKSPRSCSAWKLSISLFAIVFLNALSHNTWLFPAHCWLYSSKQLKIRSYVSVPLIPQITRHGWIFELLGAQRPASRRIFTCSSDIGLLAKVRGLHRFLMLSKMG